MTSATAASTSLCEPHRDFIEAQLRLGRKAVAIYQDLVDAHGIAGRYNSVKRFAARRLVREPEQFDRLSFLPGEEMQVDYGEGAPTRVGASGRYRSPGCSWPPCATPGAASAGWSGTPASRCGPS